jgi:hypothetical protein
MVTERKALDLGSLEEFQPRDQSSVPKRVDQKAVDQVSAFPSREAPPDDQINIKAPSATLDRFKRMAKAERYKYGEFLDRLMDAYEK